MSSSPPPEQATTPLDLTVQAAEPARSPAQPARPAAAHRWRPPSSWSLRAQLTAALVVLIVVVCGLIGVVTTTAVNRMQLKTLDSQLADAVHRANRSLGPGLPDHPQDGERPPRNPIGDSGQAAGTLLGRIVDGEVRDAHRLDRVTNQQEDLPPADYGVLKQLPEDGRPYTRDLGDFGTYRLAAFQADDGDVIVTGLPMKPVYDTRDRLIAVEILVGLGAAILAALVGAALVRRTLRPLHRVAVTATRVAELPLDRGEVALSVRVPDVDPRTEVGQVGAALNRMLGHVASALAARQASEMRVRHFVADASHELRTPLAAIRGYAELSGRYADAVPPDVAHAMRRVHSETARMTTLVEDLLLLARLDSGRPLEREQVDLTRLVIDAVGDAHVAARDHNWRLDLPDEPVTVTGDPARLHQVLANLLANARVHTPPGTVVVTKLAVAGDEVRLSVVDDGPGIPPGLLPEVFDRFARGDSSRSRAAGSTGLGLAIVAAVVEAHGGSVDVDSRPGHTAFIVRLPSRPPADEDRFEPMASGQAHRSG